MHVFSFLVEAGSICLRSCSMYNMETNVGCHMGFNLSEEQVSCFVKAPRVC